ncbi:hypothetical protein LCGC14_0784230, partial [marine sediment metagenome]
NVSELNYTYTEINPSRCWYSKDGGANNVSHVACGTNFTTITSTEDSNTWTLYMNDTTGNENSTSVTFFKDTIYPLISIISPVNNTNTTVTTTDVKYTYTEINCDSVWWQDGTGSNTTLASCGTNVTAPTWAEGKHNITVFMNDTANNVNQSYVSFTIDTTNPQIDYGANIEGDYANVTVSHIFNNVTVTEINEKNITFLLHNQTAQVNSTTFTDGTRTINWTGLNNEIYTYNVTIYDYAGNSNTTATRTITLDSTPPIITIAHPQSGAGYSNNDTIPLNYTVTDLLVGVDSCWYKVENSTKDLVIDNTTIASCANTTFALVGGDVDYNVTLYSNDSLNNVNSGIVEFGIRTVVPAIVLDAPSDNEWFDSGTSIYFNYTTTDADGLDTCQLWANSTGTWHKNYTWVGPTSGVQNFTTVTIPEVISIWAIWCNDTLNNNGFSVNNFTLNIDETNPQITLVYPTNTSYNAVQTELNYTYSDLYVDSCWYSTNGGSTNITRASCSNVTGLNSGQGSSTWLVGVNDSANNKNYSTVQFFVDSVNPLISYESETSADYSNLSQSNIYVNVTWTEINLANITFSLYNATATVNSTIFTIATYDINWTGLNDNDNYTYEVNITDTLNNKNYTLLRHITLDTANPVVNITTANNTVVVNTLSITIDYNISDAHLKECYFTLRTPAGLVHNYPENTSLTCLATSRSISSLFYATFVVQFWGEDFAGNLDDANLTFIAKSSSAGGGGGGEPIAEEEEQIEIPPKSFCGDNLCQLEGNEYGIKENWYNCQQDCKPFDFDALIWSFTKYCFDRDPSTVCFFTQQLFATVPGIGEEVAENITVYEDGQICFEGICERLSGKTLITNCFKEGPCFWKSNVAFMVLFLGGAGLLGFSFVKIRAPGKKVKVNPYQYVAIRYKRRKWRRR